MFQQFLETRHIRWMIVTNGRSNTKAISRGSKSSVLSQLVSMLVSGDGFITYEIDSFKPTIIKQTMLLYSSSLSSQPIISPPKYSRLFCQHISLKLRHMSSGNFPSIRNAFAHLRLHFLTLLIFCTLFTLSDTAHFRLLLQHCQFKAITLKTTMLQMLSNRIYH